MAALIAPASVAAYSVDRSDDADRVIEFVLDPDKRLAILYGRRGSRRRELVRDWVIPRLEGKRDAYYADCDADLPAVVAGPKGELPLEDALRGGGIVFLGRTEQCLSALDAAKEHRLAELLNRLERGELAGTLVLVTPERNLADIFGFQGAAPSLMVNILMIAIVTFRESLSRLSAAPGESGLQYAPEAIDALAGEVESNPGGDGVELARAVDQGFAYFKEGAGPVTIDHCKTIGGVAGALDEYRKGQLDKAAERWGEQGRKTVEVILSEVTSSASTGAEPDLTDVALRLGITDVLFTEVLDWLRGEGQMLRPEGDRQWDIVPAELRPLLEQQAARKLRDVMRAWALLRDGVRSWSQLGVALPRKRLDEIEAVRELLPATAEEAALIVRSLLRVDALEDTSSIRYWMRRIRSEAVEISTVVEALFADAPVVRVRAARLLDGFDNPDVRSHLYRVATEDQDREVRLAALASLAGMRVEELWALVSQEARDLESPYQLNAVAALRLFPDERAIALLSELLASRGQQLEVRAEAIDTLGAMGTSGAVKSLVEIGLNDEDAEDRSNAAAALGRIPSGERVREAVDAVRDSTVSLEHAGPLTVRRVAGIAVRSILSVLAGVLNILLHGAALIALRRYVAGAAFLGCELLLWLSSKTNWWGATDGWIILMIINWLACQLTATRIAILDQERRFEEWERSEAGKRVSRWQLGTPLTITLLLIDLVPFVVGHGLAQAMAGRMIRAIRLFGLEFFGIVCVAVGLYFFSGQYAPITPFPKLISDLFLVIYFGVGILLIVGSFFWDVVPVVNAVIVSAGRQHGWERRAALYESLAAHAYAAEYILESAGRRSEPHSRWARRLVEQTANVMPLDRLFGSLKDQPRRPGYLIGALKRMKNTEVVRAVGQEWRGAGPALRRWIIDILAGRPSEASLQQLCAVRADLDWYGKLRHAIAVWHHRLRLWPSTVIFVSVFFVPLALLAAWEVQKTMRNPARPALRMVQTPEVRRKMTPDQLIETLHFVAKAHAAASYQDLIELLNDRAGTTPEFEFKGAVAENVGTAMCSLDSTTHAKERQSLISALIHGLKEEPPRLEVARGLSEIERTPGCTVTGASKKDLAQAAYDLLKRADSRDQVQAAIAGLSVSGDPSAVEPLRNLILGLTERKTSDQIRWTDLRKRAVFALNGNPSPQAAKALSEIATGARSASLPEDMKSIAEQAARLVEQHSHDRLEEVRVPLRRGDYREAYNMAFDLLKTAPPPQFREGLVDILGQASYQLGTAETGSEEWPTKAIEYLQQTKGTSYWDKDKPRMLSNAYAIRAERVYLENYKSNANAAFKAAFNDAAHAIQEDPKTSLGYSVRAWLLKQQGKYQDSLTEVLTAIQKDPTLSWSYDLLQNLYEEQSTTAPSSNKRQQLLTQATEQFEQLAKKYPQVMWPRRRLVNIYHDWVATPEALAKSYDLYVGMERQFADQLTERDKLLFDANFIEARFTVGRYREVVDAGAALDKQLAENDYELRIPVNVLRYAALVMLGDAKGAGTELSVLQGLVSQLPRDYALTWSYSGTLAYLRRQPLESEMQKKMVALVDAAELLKNTRRLPAPVIAANRSALQAAMPRAAR